MSLFAGFFVRSDDAERLELPVQTMQLLADKSDTAGRSASCAGR